MIERLHRDGVRYAEVFMRRVMLWKKENFADLFAGHPPRGNEGHGAIWRRVDGSSTQRVNWLEQAQRVAELAASI